MTMHRGLAIIVAMGRNGEIGQGGKLPWRSPEDMRHFKELTIGRPVIMGRKTWDSIPEKFRPLEDRINIVISSTPCEKGSMYRFPTFGEALCEAYAWHEEPFVIGGARVYAAALPLATRIEVTLVGGNYPTADAFFEYDLAWWNDTFEMVATDYPQTAAPPKIQFVTYRRKKT